ncbi:MAG: pimeloyl-ACP methyl ester esterase BioH [Gammaproteobacteria bacterium]
MSLRLHTETSGRGPDVFLVHGWALHSGVWTGIIPMLAQTCRVTCVDLPGHGFNHERPMPATLTELAQQLVSVAPKHAVWLGWSLGGLVCLRAALDFPGQLRALVLVSTTPRFVTADDWPCAMSPAQLQQFVTELERDYRKTVKRFLALQVRGGESAREVLRQLRETVFARGTPQASSLRQGLALLGDSDLRTVLEHIDLPTLVMVGEYDRLTPPQAGTVLAAAIPGAKLLQFSRAAHALVLSHPAEFIEALAGFVHTLPEAEEFRKKDKHSYG